MTTRVDRAGINHQRLLQLVKDGELVERHVNSFCIPGRFYWGYIDADLRVLSYCTGNHTVVPLCHPSDLPLELDVSVATSDEMLGVIFEAFFWLEDDDDAEILTN